MTAEATNTNHCLLFNHQYFKVQSKLLIAKSILNNNEEKF